MDKLTQEQTTNNCPATIPNPDPNALASTSAGMAGERKN
jgi:hypothetical protein